MNVSAAGREWQEILRTYSNSDFHGTWEKKPFKFVREPLVLFLKLLL